MTTFQAETNQPPAARPAAGQAVIVGARPLSAAEVIAVARAGATVELAPEALVAIRHGREIIDALADDPEPHYGVSTGFGALATRHIPAGLRAQLQASLVRSHAAGSGPEVETEVVRALMLLRLATLATGRTGAREETVRTYAALLNAGITPVVHEYGSLGCSGDLAPLAHCALVLMGEGIVRDAGGREQPSAEALAAAGITPVQLREKEGLALINGTDGMLGMLVLAIADLRELLQVADITAAMSVEGLLGSDAPFAADLQALRPHPGQAAARRQHAGPAGRQRDHGQSPGPGVHPRAGRLLAALCAPGGRSGQGHRRPRGAGRRSRAGRGHRQPGDHPGRPG